MLINLLLVSETETSYAVERLSWKLTKLDGSDCSAVTLMSCVYDVDLCIYISFMFVNMTKLCNIWNMTSRQKLVLKQWNLFSSCFILMLACWIFIIITSVCTAWYGRSFVLFASYCYHHHHHHHHHLGWMRDIY